MSDIFISYASADRERASVLAKALADRGWSVWWDRNILAGQSYDQVIEREITGAKCVVVLWSRESIASEWVKNEAAAGSERGVLIPVRIEDVTPPLEFRRKQTADLSDWNGDPSDAGLQALCAGISSIISRDPGDMAIQKPSSTGRRGWLPAAIAAGIAIAVLTAFVAGRWTATKSTGDSPQSTVSQQSAVDGPGSTVDSKPSTDDSRLSTGDRRLSTDNRPPPLNLLAKENGGHLMLAPNDAWSRSIDGKEDYDSVRVGEEAVFAFRDNQPATFNRFGILITTTGRNPKELDLLAGDESPSGAFRPIGSFRPQNVKTFDTDGWQDFTFPAVTAKFVKVRLRSSFEESVWIELRELRLLAPATGN